MVYYINLHPQLLEWTGSTVVDADGSITATLMEAGMPVWKVSGETVITPGPITQDIVAGALDVDHKFQLPATSGARYWKFTIKLGTVQRTWYFTWANSATTDFSALNFINPRTYTGA